MLLCNIGAKVNILGRHHVPNNGPFVIVINHFSYIDPPFVISAIQKPINFLAASDQIIETQFIWAPFLYGFIPTNRTSLAPSTIKNAMKVIKKGEILGLFPEGNALKSHLRPAKNGAAYLSSMGNAKLLPVGIVGIENAWSQIFKGIRPTANIRIGQPFGPFRLGKTKKEKEKDLNNIGEEIMCRIAALLPDERHGIFSGNNNITLFREQNALPGF